MNLEHLKYPIGQADEKAQLSAQEIGSCIEVIEQFPANLIATSKGLTDAQLDTPYRPQGWTIRQVINHCADSHLNAFMRFKLALSEDNPSIQPYDEKKWAALADSAQIGIEAALSQLKGIHTRWVFLMKEMSTADWSRTYFHPEHQKSFSLLLAVQSYDWHCRHHLAHVQELIKRDFSIEDATNSN